MTTLSNKDVRQPQNKSASKVQVVIMELGICDVSITAREIRIGKQRKTVGYPSGLLLRAKAMPC